jgi:hypothetical protein
MLRKWRSRPKTFVAAASASEMLLDPAERRQGRKAERPVLRALAIRRDVVWPIAALPLLDRKPEKRTSL